jgi:hypothetical protein
MRQYITLIENAIQLNIFSMEGEIQKKAIDDFEKLAKLQRVKPEMMGNSMRTNPELFYALGQYTWMCEQVGDLTNRMAANPINSRCGFNTMTEKTNRILGCMNEPDWQGKSFTERVEVNIRNNFNCAIKDGKSIIFSDYVNGWKEASQKYALAHSELPVFNEAQALARDAAIALGNHDWAITVRNVKELHKHLVNVEIWCQFAGQYKYIHA